MDGFIGKFAEKLHTLKQNQIFSVKYLCSDDAGKNESFFFVPKAHSRFTGVKSRGARYTEKYQNLLFGTSIKTAPPGPQNLICQRFQRQFPMKRIPSRNLSF